jgi:hypothetical protein
MRLSLFGWPPVASHVTCLIAGLALAHISQQDSKETLKLPAKSLILTLGDLDASTMNMRSKTKSGAKIFAIKKYDNSTCRLHDKPLIVIATKPQIILSMPLQGSTSFHSIIWGTHVLEQPHNRTIETLKKNIRIEFMSEDDAEKIPSCHNTPRVNYG